MAMSPLKRHGKAMIAAYIEEFGLEAFLELRETLSVAKIGAELFRYAEGRGTPIVSVTTATAAVQSWALLNVGDWQQATRARAEHLAEESLTVVDQAGASQYEVNKAKAQAEGRRWLAGKLDRETWGEQQEQKVTGTLKIQWLK